MNEKQPDSSAADILDVKGLICPLPVLKARKILSGLAPGALLTVEATDPASVIDFPHFCSETGHALVEQSETEGVYRFTIRRKAG
ncbi:sulfurtransferase TusA family protein [Microbaculum marinisediminis]|uniref:Sulfurtransferase TusA family protein n=1 Tax=Microbaculum marinisediminis TaxID=2931392 RepID=A0AAW5R6N2_9HYPH|nr:sulfurtransferase TusA family protein [Microbaculum sp. A6E488]MCT8974558.1 sulfurtransferase TusA family protein [Microbaculum sp. A6E488]